jgi:hypothetical protein
MHMYQAFILRIFKIWPLSCFRLQRYSQIWLYWIYLIFYYFESWLIFKIKKHESHSFKVLFIIVEKYKLRKFVLFCYNNVFVCERYKIERNEEFTKNVQNNKIKNVAGSDWLSLFMEVTECASYRQAPA